MDSDYKMYVSYMDSRIDFFHKMFSISTKFVFFFTNFPSTYASHLSSIFEYTPLRSSLSNAYLIGMHLHMKRTLHRHTIVCRMQMYELHTYTFMRLCIPATAYQPDRCWCVSFLLRADLSEVLCWPAGFVVAVPRVCVCVSRCTMKTAASARTYINRRFVRTSCGTCASCWCTLCMRTIAVGKQHDAQPSAMRTWNAQRAKRAHGLRHRRAPARQQIAFIPIFPSWLVLSTRERETCTW